jgi:hypothetical protein
MIALLLGITGNVSSIVMWIPGAIVIWQNRKDVQALKGVSLLIQGFTNTVFGGICKNTLTQNMVILKRRWKELKIEKMKFP